jgi:hypothetical protein
MIYTIKEYADKIAFCHPNTLKTRIENNQLPRNHIVKKGRRGVMTVIEIIHGSENCRSCETYHLASVEYHYRKGSRVQDAELAAELCIKFDLGATKFFKMHGIK